MTLANRETIRFPSSVLQKTVQNFKHPDFLPPVLHLKTQFLFVKCKQCIINENPQHTKKRSQKITVEEANENKLYHFRKAELYGEKKYLKARTEKIPHTKRWNK
jgi:hypothetical protein